MEAYFTEVLAGMSQKGTTLAWQRGAHSGAAVVVGSLWPVDDEVTAELLEAFYRELSNGASPEQALTQAQRSVRLRWPHPFYWAGLQVVSGT